MHQIRVSTLHEWIREILTTTFPDAASCPPADLTGGISNEIQVATGFGFQQNDHLSIYVITAWVLGTDFPNRFPAAHNALHSPNMSPGEKASWLSGWTTSLLSTLETDRDQ